MVVLTGFSNPCQLQSVKVHPVLLLGSFGNDGGNRGSENIRVLRSNDANGNENVKRAIGLKSKTTTLHVHHTFSVHFFPAYARLRLENA